MKRFRAYLTFFQLRVDVIVRVMEKSRKLFFEASPSPPSPLFRGEMCIDISKHIVMFMSEISTTLSGACIDSFSSRLLEHRATVYSVHE